MITFPPCKINIGLFVTDKRADNYHNLQSIFYPLSLCDALEIRFSTSSQSSFSIAGLQSKEILATGAKLSIQKAYEILKSDFPDLPNVNMFLSKAIPTFAGLGSGSSDATSALLLLNQMCNLNLSHSQLHNYASQLGADNTFFLENQPMFVYSKGEKMQAIDFSLKDYYIVLVKPNLNISTAEAYQSIHLTPQPYDLRNLDPNDISNWKNYIHNDFEQHLFKTYPVLQDIKDNLYSLGALYAQMSGSGSTIYGIFSSAPNIQNLSLPKDTFIHIEQITN